MVIKSNPNNAVHASEAACVAASEAAFVLSCVIADQDAIRRAAHTLKRLGEVLGTTAHEQHGSGAPCFLAALARGSK